MDECRYCSAKDRFTVRCGHGITCYTYGTCSKHVGKAVMEILSEPDEYSCRVDMEG